MGNIFTKKNNIKNDHFKDYDTFAICTLNTRFTQSANYKEKISILTDFVFNSNYDVICLQGINDYKLLRLVVKNIFTHNLTTNDLHKLTTYPLIETFYVVTDSDIGGEILKVTWSNSDDTNISEINSLIITKHNIISGTKIVTSQSFSEKDKNFYLVNIEFNGVLISICNATLQNDFIGISNFPTRKIQINQLRDTILQNNDNIKSDNIYKNCVYRNINIICCQANINELYNNDINGEYLYFTRTLKALDSFRYVKTIKGKPVDSLDSTNVSGTRSNYILLTNLNTQDFNDIRNIYKALYSDQKIIIINSVVIPEIRSYDDYPVVTTLMIKKISDNEKLLLSQNDQDDDIAIEIY